MKTIAQISDVTSKMLAGLLVILVIPACSKSKNSATTPGANEVFIQNFTFSPSTITVTAGTTITWTNKDAVAHTVTSDDGLFDSGSINPDGNYSHLFPTPGTFNYHCSIHPNMVGKVIVQASSGY
jgi:plastocyanin